jgi:pimeloyl-ACP methyl ester carboxylesterase
LPVANASIWTGSGMSSHCIQSASTKQRATLYARPGAIRAGFAQFAAFGKDALDSKTYLAKGKLNTPVLALEGEAAFGAMMATVMRCVRTDVQEAIVPDSGHWIMEENPSATIKLVTNFLKF